jgi:hypothetical protein
MVEIVEERDAWPPARDCGAAPRQDLDRAEAEIGRRQLAQARAQRVAAHRRAKNRAGARTVFAGSISRSFSPGKGKTCLNVSYIAGRAPLRPASAHLMC